jgi:DNA-binding MarR family transcriptional regulator
MGVTQYHLYTLERERKILSRRSGLYKRFFPSLVFGEQQQGILDVLSQETERDLLLYIIQNPGSNQKELSQYARISPGTTNWHMKRLTGSGLVQVKHEGQYVKYEISGESKEILNLVQSYHPSLWQTWVDRFANAINEVSALPQEDQLGELDLGEDKRKEKVEKDDKRKGNSEKSQE